MNFFHQSDGVKTSGCLYGNGDRRNKVLFGYQVFVLIMSISLSFLLFGSQKLRRIYLPLYYTVNTVLVLKIAGSIVYFMYYPYGEGEGNCSEISIGRLFILLTMFGELHQTYFISKVLGLSNLKFQPFGLSQFSVTLTSILQAAIILATITLAVSLFVRQIFMIARNFWSLFVVVIQLYIVKRAKAVFGQDHLEAVIDPNSDAVGIFEGLSWLQILPTLAALTDRILEFNGLELVVSVDGVMLILEYVVNVFFFVKVLVIQEKAGRVNVEVYNDGK